MMTLVYILAVIGAILIFGPLIVATVGTRGPFVYLHRTQVFGIGMAFISAAVMIWQTEENQRLQRELRQAYYDLNLAQNCQSQLEGYMGLSRRLEEGLSKCQAEVNVAKKLRCTSD